MIEQIYTYFTIEMLYMWINIGILPFWFMLIFFPQSHLGRIFVASIFPIFILSGVYIFVLYKSYLIGYDFIGNFTLYLGLVELSRLFEDHLYLMVFWTHFVAINLFLGGWIVKDAQKFNINKTYSMEHNELISGKLNRACTLIEGKKVLKLIEKINKLS